MADEIVSLMTIGSKQYAASHTQQAFRSQHFKISISQPIIFYKEFAIKG